MEESVRGRGVGREEKDTRPGAPKQEEGSGYPPLARLARRDLGSDLIAEARRGHPRKHWGLSGSRGTGVRVTSGRKRFEDKPAAPGRRPVPLEGEAHSETRACMPLPFVENCKQGSGKFKGPKDRGAEG